VCCFEQESVSDYHTLTRPPILFLRLWLEICSLRILNSLLRRSCKPGKRLRAVGIRPARVPNQTQIGAQPGRISPLEFASSFRATCTHHASDYSACHAARSPSVPPFPSRLEWISASSCRTPRNQRTAQPTSQQMTHLCCRGSSLNCSITLLPYSPCRFLV
jgi:hypothetical protein